MNNQDEGLKREIGVWGLSANMVNIIIGSGIFVLPAIVAGILGPASIIAYAFCGLLVLLIMLCYAEIGSKTTSSGGGYTYVVTAFGKYPGFLVFLLGFIARICAIAAVANALVDTLAVVFPVFHAYSIKFVFFVLLFFGFASINILGVKQGVGLVKFNTIAKLLPLVLLIVVGFFFIDTDNLKWTATPSLQHVGEASLVLFFAFTGGPTGLIVGGEIKHPERTVPRAVIISIVFLILFYIAIQIVVQGVLGSRLSPEMASPLAVAGQVVFGPMGFTFILLGTAISMFGNVSGQTLNTPRSLFAVSRDGVLPIKAFQKIHKKFATPCNSILTFSTLGFLFAASGGFRTLAVFSVAGALLGYATVSLAVLKFRKMPEMKNKGFTIPGGIAVPLISIVISLFFLYHLKVIEIISISVFLVIATILYLGLYRIRQFTKRESGIKKQLHK
ncbi:APC family permease [Flavobacteriaceae bacterium F89]|uniref:APC family permease n=1 Tax=Cerina litoralis TaxID=2874477 RepID=A0AAE3ESB0_9FLAO|nr:amino acid permease [Cerina litoralis]MCG2459259.1 APC family permease [Cerina litoralis]